MTHAQFLAWIEGVESEFPVTEWTIRGIRIWPLVRLTLYASAFQSAAREYAVGAGPTRHARNIAHGLTGWARARLGDPAANRPRTARADAVFLTSSLGRQPLVDGKRYNPLCAPYVGLLERLGRKALVWELSPFGDYNTPRHTPSSLIQPGLTWLRILSLVRPIGAEQMEVEGYSEFVIRAARAGLASPYADIVRLRRDVLFLRLLADWFAGWLRRVRPGLGFVADTGLRQQAFCLACHELGITSVEIQHGVQGPLHPAYGSWHAVPLDGYPTRARVFWCWDAESAAAINAWTRLAPTAHVALAAGDPWREMWARDGAAVTAGTHARIAERKRLVGTERHALVTLDSHGELLPAPLHEAMRSAPRSWSFWLRLHPVNQTCRRQQVAALAEDLGLDLDLMDFATEMPLHALLRHMDCHITPNISSVVIEAAAAEVPSIACGPEAAAFYPSESARGLLVAATTAGEVRAALDSMLATVHPRGRSPGTDTEAVMRHIVEDADPLRLRSRVPADLAPGPLVSGPVT